MSRALTRGRGGVIKAREGRTSIDQARLLMDADAVLLADRSGSMGMTDAGEMGDRQRWDVMNEVVNNLVDSLGDKIAIVAFDTATEVVNDQMPSPGGGTDIGKTINFCKPVAAFVKHVVLVSDGEPENSSVAGLSPREAALKAAKEFGRPIDVVFCGEKSDTMHGRAFMKKLADASGGKFQTGKFEPQLLTDQVMRLLTDKI